MTWRQRVLYDTLSVLSQIMNEHNVHQIVRDQLTQQPAATSFQALRRVASQETYAGSYIRRLANQVGGPTALL